MTQCDVIQEQEKNNVEKFIGGKNVDKFNYEVNNHNEYNKEKTNEDETMTDQERESVRKYGETWNNFVSKREKLFENNTIHQSSFMEFGAQNISREQQRYRPENLTFVYPDDLLEDVEMTKSGIPKILWRTYKSTKLPERWVEGFESGFLLKGWKMIFMTDEDNYEFVKRHYPDLLYTYENFEYNIQRVDLIRILYLHKFGGLYSDLDKVFLTDFSSFFDQNVSDVFLVRSPNIHSVYTNSFMASKPNSEFWIELINAILEKKLPFYAFGRHLKVMNSTGPSILTRVARNTNSVIGLLPSNSFERCSYCVKDCPSSIERGQYVKQIKGSSWITIDSLVYLTFLCSWPQMLILILFVVSIIYITFLI